MMNLSSLGCLTCAKAFEHAGGNAAGWAILVMLIILVPVLSTIGFCMVRLARREKDHLDPELQDPLMEN